MFVIYRNFLERLMKMSKRDTFCRTCMSPLKTSDELSSLSYNIFNSDNLDVKLLLCTNLKCVPWDDYPHSLCEVCYRKVLDFHNFQCMCRTSLEKFNDMLQNQIELKSDTDAEEDCEENRLNFMAEYADISSHPLEEKISIHSEEIQSTTEQQYNTCVDPLSDQTNDDFVNADNKKSKKCLKLEEDVKECTTFKEISKKQRTRKRKSTVKDDIAEESENRKFHSDIVSRKRKSKTKIHGTPIEDTEIEDDKDFENEDVPADFPDDTVSYFP